MDECNNNIKLNEENYNENNITNKVENIDNFESSLTKKGEEEFKFDAYFEKNFKNQTIDLEKSSTLQEKELLDLMFTLHTMSSEIENIKKEVTISNLNNTHNTYNVNRKKNINIETVSTDGFSNNSKLNMSTMSNVSRRSISKSRMNSSSKELGMNKTTVKDKFNLMSPKVSINIGFEEESNTSSNNFNRSVDRRNMRSIDLKEKQKNYADKLKNTITKKELAPQSIKKITPISAEESSSGNVSLKATPKRNENKKKEIVYSNSNNGNSTKNNATKSNLNATYSHTYKKQQSNGSGTISPLTENKNKTMKIKPNLDKERILSSTTLTAVNPSRVSFKFEPKKRVSMLGKDVEDLNENQKSSFKSDENINTNTKIINVNQHTRASSDHNMQNIKPKQLHFSNFNTHSNNNSDNKIFSFISNFKNKPIFTHVLNFLNPNKNKLKNISNSFRYSYIEQQIKKMEEIKSLKKNQLEEEGGGKNSLELILEMEILSHKEDKLKGLLTRYYYE
jgi:hypothetical protein